MELCAGSARGVIVDRYNRKNLTIFAHSGIAVSLLCHGLAVTSDSELPIYWFFVTVNCVTIFRNLYQGSHDGLIHTNVGPRGLVCWCRILAGAIACRHGIFGLDVSNRHRWAYSPDLYLAHGRANPGLHRYYVQLCRDDYVLFPNPDPIAVH